MIQTILLNRFWKRIIFSNSLNCWEWKGCKSHNGYGFFYNGIKNIRPHRFSYELFKGKIPKELCLDHLCRNRSCVNPDHLEAVTPKENVLRGVGISAKNSKKTHCLRGHPLIGDNLYAYKNLRACKTCRKEQK